MFETKLVFRGQYCSEEELLRMNPLSQLEKLEIENVKI